MVYLMRHGLDDENYIGGWSDVDLTDMGIKQVEESAIWIKNNLHIKKIISSDIYRAYRTAEIVNKYLDINIEKNINLREQNKGLLNGMLKSEANIKYEDLLKSVDKDTIYPQGESLENLYKRIKEYLSILIAFDDDTLIVTHRGVINMIYYILNDIPLDMNKERFNVTHGSVHELDVDKMVLRKVR